MLPCITIAQVNYMIDDGLCLVVGVEARCDPEPPILVVSIEMDIEKTADGGEMENGKWTEWDFPLPFF